MTLITIDFADLTFLSRVATKGVWDHRINTEEWTRRLHGIRVCLMLDHQTDTWTLSGANEADEGDFTWGLSFTMDLERAPIDEATQTPADTAGLIKFGNIWGEATNRQIHSVENYQRVLLALRTVEPVAPSTVHSTAQFKLVERLG
jgi:hypothetical protein